MAFLYDMLEKDMDKDMFNDMDVDQENHAEETNGVREPASTPPQRVFQPRLDPLEEYSEREFLQRYRLPKKAVSMLGERMKDQNILGGLNGKGWALTPELTVCLGLRFLATGAMYREIGKEHHVARSTVCRGVARTLRLLIGLADEYILFPYTDAQKKDSALEFARRTGFPCVVGVLDSTHIGLKAPTAEEIKFRNAKGDSTINTQVICDASGRFIDVDPSWPGSAPDHKVWKASIIGKALKKHKFLLGNYILGHNGYPSLPWLLTPYLVPETQAQQNYNANHELTRAIGKECISLWKMRFRCLDKTGPHALQSSPLTCNKIILSTAVLHNMAMAHNVNMQDVDEREEPLPNTQPQVQIYGGDEDDYLLTKQGEEERQFLVQNRFTQG